MSVDRSTSPTRLRARTRAALGQLVGDVLSAPLGALETRLSQSRWLGARLGAASAPGGRLREVLERDRALVAAQPAAAAVMTPESSAPVLEVPVEESCPPVQAAAPVVMPEDGAEDVAAEPIRTRTMARLLAAQGYRARALAIYRALLAECPSNAELEAEIERLSAQPA